MAGAKLGLMTEPAPKLSRNDWRESAVLGPRGPAARDFADLVAIRLVGTVLPHSEREALVKAAKKRHISRFEANLIIAAVQHQLGIGTQRVVEQPHSTRRTQIAAALAAFVAIQGLIVLAVWHFLF
jgi:hypothetical protein